MRQAVEIIVIRARQFAGFVKRLKGSPEKKQATIRKRQRNETRGPSRVLSPHALDGDGFEYVTSRAGTNAEAAAASEEKKKKRRKSFGGSAMTSFLSRLPVAVQNDRRVAPDGKYQSNAKSKENIKQCRSFRRDVVLNSTSCRSSRRRVRDSLRCPVGPWMRR